MKSYILNFINIFYEFSFQLNLLQLADAFENHPVQTNIGILWTKFKYTLESLVPTKKFVHGRGIEVLINAIGLLFSTPAMNYKLSTGKF